MPRPKKTEVEVAMTRAKILDTAYEILQESGLQALTSRSIAERLGIAHMSLFHNYFENQAAILTALREREMEKINHQRQILELQVEKTDDIVRVVEEMLRFPIRLARENPNIFYLAWVMPEAGLESIEQNRNRLQASVEQLGRLLTRGMDQGIFVIRNPTLAAATVLGMVTMPHILFQSGRLADPDWRDRMVEETIAAALKYLLI